MITITKGNDTIMKKSLLILSTLLLVGTSLNADINTSFDIETDKKATKAKKIFRKKLQRKCGYTISHFAQKHTVEEWQDLKSPDSFKKEFATLCPKGKDVLKDKWINSIHYFAEKFAKDAKVRPKC